MIRTLFVLALTGAVLFSAAPVLAAEQPLTAPTAPSSALPETFRTSNQTSEIAAAPAGSAISRQAVPSTSLQQVSPGATVTATAAVTPTARLTGSNALTVTGTLTDQLSAPSPADAPGVAVTGTLTASDALTATEAITTSTPVTLPVTATPDPALDSQYAGVLEGTIIANRTDADVRFFAEGQVYDLAPLRALGLPLARPTAVLNLFNCDARQSEIDAGCFWDPYLLRQEGFYEIVNGDGSGALVSLILREAGAPPANQIWVQNRTGERESILVNKEVVEIAPASVEQFTLDGTDAVVVHLRNCIMQGTQTACEWAPQSVDRGYYYSLVKLSTAGANNMTVSTTKLEGIVASSGEVVERPPQASCLLRVPTLNVRSGPGLEFPVVAKVRGTEEEPGSVVVVGYDATKQWMRVSDRIAQGGWVTSNPDFIICTGDLAALPVAGGASTADAANAATAVAETPVQPETAVAEAVAEPVAEVPVTEDAGVEAAPGTEAEPIAEAEPVAEPALDEAVDGMDAQPTEAITETVPVAQAIPAGQARITVYNQFDWEIRFTLDQRYRSEFDNPTGEWDLQPGQSVSILVFPGMVPYSVSSPWNGLSGNANLNLSPDEDRALYVTFIPDPDGSGDWILQAW